LTALNIRFFSAQRVHRGSGRTQPLDLPKSGATLPLEHFRIFTSQYSAARCGFSSTPASKLAGDPVLEMPWLVVALLAQSEMLWLPVRSHKTYNLIVAANLP